jgi:hypothetical protein
MQEDLIMDQKFILKRPTRGSGNPGFSTPFDDGFCAAAYHLNAGYPYDNPYNQPGEEEAQADFAKGFDAGIDYYNYYTK